MHDLTRGHADGASEPSTRYFEYTVFFSDDRAAVIHATSRDAALEEARGFYPAAPAERIFDGWRTYGAITGSVLGQVSGRPGKGTVGDPGPRGDRPIMPRPKVQQKRPPLLLWRYRVHYQDDSTAELYAADAASALRKARTYHSPVAHLDDGTRRITASEIDEGKVR